MAFLHNHFHLLHSRNMKQVQSQVGARAPTLFSICKMIVLNVTPTPQHHLLTLVTNFTLITLLRRQPPCYTHDKQKYTPVVYHDTFSFLEHAMDSDQPGEDEGREQEKGENDIAGPQLAHNWLTTGSQLREERDETASATRRRSSACCFVLLNQ